MQKIRTIVAATDFSADADQALRRAALLASEHGAALQLLHVLEPDPLLAMRNWLDAGRDLPALVSEQAGILLAASAQQLQQAHGVHAAPVLRSGHVLQELAAAEQRADLLVLGARGTHAVRELALGTTADRLLRTATRPLVVVKQPPTAAYRRILLLVGLGPSSAAAIGAATRIAAGADITLLHAYEVPYETMLRRGGVSEEEVARLRTHARDDATAELERLVAAGGDRLRTSVVLRPGDIRLELRTQLERLQPDLVVVAKQGTSQAADLFLGSVTRVVLAEAPCDVLVVPKGAVPG